MGEGILIVVGIGTAAFMLAMSRIATAEAARVLDLHFIRIKAMNLRNEYARTVLALQPDGRKAPGRRAEPMVVSPIDEPGELPVTEASPRRAA